MNPNDYAGLYYEGEQLKIAIKDSVPNGAMARTVAQSGLDADFVEVTYSMSDLLNAHGIIEKSLEEIGAKAVGINTEENAIALYVEDADSYDVALVKEISPVKNIVLREMRGFSFLDPSEQADENKNARASDVVAGDWISVRSSTNRWSTLATSVCYDYGGPNQQIGYVTCGHGYKVGDQTWYGGTSSSASTQKCRTDASFIPSSRLHTGKTQNGKVIATHDVPVAGKYVDETIA